MPYQSIHIIASIISRESPAITIVAEYKPFTITVVMVTLFTYFDIIFAITYKDAKYLFVSSLLTIKHKLHLTYSFN